MQIFFLKCSAMWHKYYCHCAIEGSITTVRKPQITVLTEAIIYFYIFWNVTPFNGISSKTSVWNFLPHYRASNNLQHSIKLLYRTPLTTTFRSTYKGVGGGKIKQSVCLIACRWNVSRDVGVSARSTQVTIFPPPGPSPQDRGPSSILKKEMIYTPSY